MQLVRDLLTATPPATSSLSEWWEAAQGVLATIRAPLDRALLGGAYADRLGFAFAAGYAEAVRALVPDVDGVTALCITETKGNHPRAIETTLSPTVTGHELTGHKTWATMGSVASALLVAAKAGEREGKPQLRLVRVAANAPGVRITPTTAAFVPEIPHAEITFERTPVITVLPGDGYTDYVKPFRTVEDLHVHAALVGYLIGVARRHGWPRELVERLLALAATTRALATDDREAPSLHLTLAGLLSLVVREVGEIERLWSDLPDEEWQRWQRDRVLLTVAGAARAARRDKAWAMHSTLVP